MKSILAFLVFASSITVYGQRQDTTLFERSYDYLVNKNVREFIGKLEENKSFAQELYRESLGPRREENAVRTEASEEAFHYLAVKKFWEIYHVSFEELNKKYISEKSIKEIQVEVEQKVNEHPDFTRRIDRLYNIIHNGLPTKEELEKIPDTSAKVILTILSDTLKYSVDSPIREPETTTQKNPPDSHHRPRPAGIPNPIKAVPGTDSTQTVPELQNDTSKKPNDSTIQKEQDQDPPPPPVPYGYILVTILITLIGSGWILDMYMSLGWRLKWKYKAIVYIISEEDREVAKKGFKRYNETEGFIAGDLKAMSFLRMKRKGLAIVKLKTGWQIINTPGNPRKVDNSQVEYWKVKKNGVRPIPFLYKVNIGLPESLSISPLPFPQPQVYIISLKTPLFPNHERALKEKGVVILKRLPVNNYLVKAGNEVGLPWLFEDENLAFIHMVSPYMPEDKGIVLSEHGLELNKKNEPIILDIILVPGVGFTFSTDLLSMLESFRAVEILSVMPFLSSNELSEISTIRIRADWDSLREMHLTSIGGIESIQEYIPPTFSTEIARTIIRLDDRESSNFEETGQGEIVAVADSGIDAQHPDFNGKIMEVVGWPGGTCAEDLSGHGTHVSGIIVGTGAASMGSQKGVAPGAKIFVQSIENEEGDLMISENNLESLFQQAFDKGARIHNNSWGSDLPSLYTSDSFAVDRFVQNHENMLIVIAAGNAGRCSGKSRWKKDLGYVDLKSIESPATSKNGLTIGASRSSRKTGGLSDFTYGQVWEKLFPFLPTSGQKVSGDPESLFARSSRGPCNDNRLKPDLVAPGTDIVSTRSSDAADENFDGIATNTAYAYLSGTSMAAPFVSGAAALVREYYRKKKKQNDPSAALIKATLINGTRKLTGKDALHLSSEVPNSHQGFGILNLLYTIPNKELAFALHFIDTWKLREITHCFTKNGQSRIFQLSTTRQGWIRICLAYTDPPARGTQNLIHLVVRKMGTRKISYGLDELQIQNNVKLIRIDSATPGIYEIHVSIQDILFASRQDYALVVTTSDLDSKFSRV